MRFRKVREVSMAAGRANREREREKERGRKGGEDGGAASPR